MLPTPKNYSIWPTVAKVGKETEFVIAPNERAFTFFEGSEYKLRIMAVNSINDYYKPDSQKLFLKAKDGVLRFSYTFEKEQEYVVRIIYCEKLVQDMYMYALNEDLYSLRPLKGDLHTHSYRSDGKRDPAALAGHFREQGYDFFALTDHNRYYPGGEIDEVYEGVNCGFNRVFGEEVHTPTSPIHIVHIGGKHSVAEQYIENRDAYEREVSELIEKVPENVPDEYKERYAMAMWATGKIHEAGGIAIFPHPFWRPSFGVVYNVDHDFARILLSSGMFDAYELIGGMKQPDNNCSVAMWNDLRTEGSHIPAVGSSDVHGIENAKTFPNYFTIAFAKENSNDAIVEAVKSSMCVAVESCGYEYDRQYRAYGSYRLVAYAQFLLKYYFPIRQRMCHGEGVAMRVYAMGEADAKLVELEAEMNNSFADRFFGKKAPILPNATILAFEDKWRETHINVGPVTKGSAIDSDTVTRQI